MDSRSLRGPDAESWAQRWQLDAGGRVQAVAARVPQDQSFLAPMAAGAGSGLVASLIRVPTEVIKQRMQSGARPACTPRPAPLRHIVAADATER